MRVLFFGTPDFALPTLEALLRHHEVVAVVTQPDRPAHRGQRPTPPPVKGRMSRQSRHFPVASSVHLLPDERGPHYLLTVTATDRLGLLYSIARVLARHNLNVHTAKVLTLGERAEDVFLISGAELADAKTQLEIEGDLLEAISP